MGTSYKTGVELIAQERQEQIEKHGRTVALDDARNQNGQLLWAAAHLLAEDFTEQLEDCCPDGWDEEIWDRMRSKTPMERLIMAGALVAAEIDRLNYRHDG